MAADEKENVVKAATEIVNKGGGNVSNSQVWLENQKMTFPIKKCEEGTYYLINFESEGESIEKINPHLRLNEKILRYAITQIEK